MNNEPNKPTELTEKELEGISAGGESLAIKSAPQLLQTVEAEVAVILRRSGKQLKEKEGLESILKGRI